MEQIAGKMEDYEELKEILGNIRILDNLGNKVMSEEMNLRKTIISRLVRMSRYDFCRFNVDFRQQHPFHIA
jgi:hypothetical protein